MQGGLPLAKGADGVFSVMLPALAAGAYRYRFTVDGVATSDPSNPSTSESNSNAWSLFYVPGAAFMDTQRVAHGSIAEVHYYSTALDRTRRMHVYTPPGYERNRDVVSRLLSAARRVRRRRLVVHRRPRGLHPRQPDRRRQRTADDRRDARRTHEPLRRRRRPAGSTWPTSCASSTRDIMPYVEANYRVRTGRA